MIVQYFLDHDIPVDFSGVESREIGIRRRPRADCTGALAGEVVTEQIITLAKTAREDGDYLGEQFMQWLLNQQVEEVASMATLLTIADRAGANLFDLENFVAREMNTIGKTPPVHRRRRAAAPDRQADFLGGLRSAKRVQ